jgi:hypothetical protein
MVAQKLVTEAPQVALDSRLPLLSAAGVSARVNAYIVGKTASYSPAGSSPLSPGCDGSETDLWYLSLIAPRGGATTLRGIWSHLVDRQGRSAWLEDQTKPNGRGVSLMLGSLRKGLLSTLSWRPHFRWFQGPIGASRELHALLEPVELTCWDPLLGQAGNGRQSRTSRQGTSADVAQQEEEAEAKEAHPLFLLLARPQEAPEQRERSLRLARLHLLFLSTRLEWLAYYEPHARYLWERALEEQEAEELYTYCFAEADQPPHLAGAFLCRPQPLRLDAALRQAIRNGVFAPRATRGVPSIAFPSRELVAATTGGHA